MENVIQVSLNIVEIITYEKLIISHDIFEENNSESWYKIKL